MKGTSLILYIVLALMVIFTPLSAYSGAAVVNLPETGQTVSLYPGDDGDLQIGIAWPGPRFQDNGDGTITDMLTGLMWMKDANCADTVNYEPSDDGVCSITTTYEACSNNADCPTGACQLASSARCKVNGDCPRGACSITTSTRCDRNWQCPGGETCVTDNLDICVADAGEICTFPQNGQLLFKNALQFVDDIDFSGLDISSCTSTSYTDWRVPNVNELESLVKSGYQEAGNCGGPGCATLADWLMSQGFDNVQSAGVESGGAWTSPCGGYWVSTAYMQWIGGAAWAIQMCSGTYKFIDPEAGDDRDTDIQIFVWPVRDSGTLGTVSLPRTGYDDSTDGDNVNYIYCSQSNYNPIDCPTTPPGSTSPYLRQQDGYLEKGVAWPMYIGGTTTPSGRFINNGDSTMTDLLTGRMWTQSAGIKFDMGGNAAYTWQGAIDFVDDMNTGANGRCIKPPSIQDCSAFPWPPGNPPTQPCVDPLLPTCMVVGVVEQCRGAGNVICATDADCDNANGETCVFIPNYGYTDWRVPNRVEQRGLTHWFGDPTDPWFCPPYLTYLKDWFIGCSVSGINGEGFLNVGNSYWTSTSFDVDKAAAWSTLLGSVGYKDKTKSKGLWPVRTEGGDDGDGVPVEVEDNAPNFGDGNDDGILDLLQPLVTSLPLPGGDYVTVVTDGAVGGCTQNMNVQTAIASPADPGFSYPLGVVGFEIRCATGPADMEIIFHGSSDISGMVYRNYGSTGPAFGATEWYEMTGATFGTRVIGGQTVATATFQIADNQLGDHNDALNIIVSLGGPGLPAPPTAIPSMTQWGMVVFMLIAVAGAVYYLSRRRRA